MTDEQIFRAIIRDLKADDFVESFKAGDHEWDIYRIPHKFVKPIFRLQKRLIAFRIDKGSKQVVIGAVGPNVDFIRSKCQ